MHRRLSSPLLLGRAAEIAALSAALAAVTETGTGRVVVIAGNAGLGKSRLVEEFSAAAGVATIAGGGIPLAGEAPYAPMLDVLQALADRYPAGAGRLLPGSGSTAADPMGTTRLFAAVAEAIGGVTADAPLLLVVEDVQWIDAASRDLVAFLARSIRRRPVLMLVTARTEEVVAGSAIAGYLSELSRGPHADRIELDPLDRADLTEQVRAITGVQPSTHLIDQLAARGGGNPLFTEELLASGPDADRLPPTIRDLILTRTARLPTAGQAILRAAAVAGRTVEAVLLARMVADADLSAGLPVVLRHGFLLAHPGGYAFRHPLIQEAVYADIPPPERAVWHVRAAEGLRATPSGRAAPAADATALRVLAAGSAADRAGHAARIAAHWRAAGRQPDALRATVTAGQLALAAHAPAAALVQYRHAVAAFTAVPDAAGVVGLDHAEILAQAAEAAAAAGDAARARAWGSESVERIDPDVEPARRALRLERLARFTWLDGDPEQAHRLYTEALATVPDQPSTARARILAATAQSLMLRTRHVESLTYAHAAVAAARIADAHPELAHALDGVGTNLAAMGRLDDAVRYLSEALAVATAIDDSTEIARCYVNLTEAYSDALRSDDAITVGRRGARLATEAGLGRVYGAAITGSVVIGLYQSGRWDDALAEIEAQLDADPLPWSSVPLLRVRADIALARGDRTTARLDLDRIEAIPGTLRDAQFGPLVRGGQAALAAHDGDLDTARDLADRALSQLDTTDDVYGRFELATAVAAIEADFVIAHRAGARRPDPLATARVDRYQRAARAAAERCCGGVVGEAMRLYDATITAHRSRLDAPADARPWTIVAESPRAPALLSAHAHYYAAVAHLTGRHRASAATSLANAARAADRLGAVPLRRAIDTLAGRARLDPDRTRVEDPLGLTPREHEILALLDTGLSNADIAQTLFISEKTASTHVSNILRKLGVTSRSAAARRARD